MQYTALMHHSSSPLKLIAVTLMSVNDEVNGR